MTLEEILALNHAHIRSKEAEVLGLLTKFIAPAKAQLDRAKRDLGYAIPPQFLSSFIDPADREVARHTVKTCTCLLFDVYAEAVSPYVLDAEPFIALLPSIATRVRATLGIMDNDEAEVRSLKWQSIAWDRDKPTLFRRLLKWLLSLLTKPLRAGASVPVARESNIGDVEQHQPSGGTLPNAPPSKHAGDKPACDGPEPAKVAVESAGAAPNAPSPLGAGQPILIEEFLDRCNNEPGLTEKILKKHIWASAGHKSPRQFQYWQAGDAAATAEDEKNFGRILAMSPTAFIAQLKRSNLISDKS